MAIDSVIQVTATPAQLAVMHPSYTAEYWRRLLRQGRIPGASKPFGKWFIPINAVRAFLESGNHEHVDAA